MELDRSACYRALVARDARFDGRFFVGVRTTGVYCRPICPARTPKRQNVGFFVCAAAAEAAGFRPCRRCRPEAAPGTPAWNGTGAVVSRALRLIADGALDDARAAALGSRLGIGERQLRRLFEKHLGASPAAIARARRVHFAKMLLDDTSLPMTTVALSAGFQSIRQFNHSIRQSFGRTPTELRRMRRATGNGEIAVRLAYRPPLDWSSLLDFLRLRAIPGVEAVNGSVYRRTIECGGDGAVVSVAPLAGQNRVELRLDTPPLANLARVVDRVRRVFDLDADPGRIDALLSRDPVLRSLVHTRPGLRVPGAWDPFELVVRAILGQQVSVAAARTMAGRLVARFGEPLRTPREGLTHLFPTPAKLAEADAADVARIGLTSARAQTIRALSRAVASGELRLDATLAREETLANLTALPGIGEWTAQYVAMRAFGEPDAFPAGDLGLRRAVANGDGLPSARALAGIAEAWRPWRAYAAVRLWTGAASAT
jgi:AraC family transcriptional regulator, regulatory protein of adaptative response / DNA-3-methyladenine glycosylase II